MDKEALNLIDVLSSKSGLGTYFDQPDTWEPWMVFFKALMGLRIASTDDLELFRDCTGLSGPPSKPFKEAFVIAGRRSGKSTICALLSVFFAVWGNWERHMAKGESVKIFVIACNKHQARIIVNYVKAIFQLTPFLKGMVKRVLAEAVELKNNVEIVVKPASWRSTRGFTIGLLILEELAYWRFESESAVKDKEVYTALKPSTITVPNSLIIGISTPFARQGFLFEKFNRHYGKPGSVLIWKAPTWVMNKTLTEEELRTEHAADLGEAEFGAEYMADFREDIEGFLPLETIERAVVIGRMFCPPDADVSEYVGFCDPSEGMRKGGDSMTYAIAHKDRREDSESDVFVLDYLFEARAPFDNKQVVREIALISKQYGIYSLTQDRHAIGWIAADLEEYGIQVEGSVKTKSEIYEFFGVMMNKGEVELLDNPRLKTQLMGLQRFLKSGGLVKIDHLRSGHDDIVNAAAGAIELLKTDTRVQRDIMIF